MESFATIEKNIIDFKKWILGHPLDTNLELVKEGRKQFGLSLRDAVDACGLNSNNL